MNRDERLERFAALAPAIIDINGRRAVFPREPTGGTWISANEVGICLALINWHRIAEPGASGHLLPKKRNRPDATETRNSWAIQPLETTGCPSDAERVEREANNGVLSRGEVVRELAGKSTADEIAAAIKKLPLRKLRPFRLIVIVPSERRLIECRWNLKRLAIRNHQWRRRHWFSSGFDEPRAELERAKVCASASVIRLRRGYGGQDAAGYSLTWLRELHRSHAPNRGPFSICMHRPDAMTVSYTEVVVSKQRATMRYKSGPPCSNGANVTRTISLALSV